MSMMADLLGRLRSAGIPLDEVISGAMESVDPADFTDFHLEPFWHDRPVPFLFTDLGATRTISAPHMIVTLLHHLELQPGQEVPQFELFENLELPKVVQQKVFRKNAERVLKLT